MKIITTTKGDLTRTKKHLKKCLGLELKIEEILKRTGEKGVHNLKKATPKKTGKTANSWIYTIKKTSNGYTLTFDNTNEVDGCKVALLIQYGHGTGWGGYVEGNDYIRPVVKPLLKETIDEIRKEVEIL